MTATQAIDLTNRICAFLVSCGELYKEVTEDLQKTVIDSLVSGQYALKESGGEILFYAYFWRLRDEDLETVKRFKQPENVTVGPYFYIVEAGSKQCAAEMMRALKGMNFDATHVIGHRRGRFRQVRLYRGEST